MRAILRYALVKTSREQFLHGLLFAPAVIFLAPLLGLAAVSLFKGRAVYPIALDFRLGPQGSAAVLWEASLPFSAIIAGIAAFRALRSEVVSKTVGMFYLAAPPRTVTAAVTVYGAVVGTLSCLLAVLVVGLLTGTPHQDLGGHILTALVSATISSALGTLMLAISSDFTMLVPVCAAGIAAAMMVKSAGAGQLAAVVAGIAVLMVITQFVWGRRCAV